MKLPTGLFVSNHLGAMCSSQGTTVANRRQKGGGHQGQENTAPHMGCV